MKYQKIMRILSIVLLFTISSLYGSSVIEMMKAEKRTALVVGNNSYQGGWAILRNPINDAKAIKEILEERGFNVIYTENATKRELRISLETFYKEIENGGVGLFYFAGHGIELDGKNYLIPIDANFTEKKDAEFEAVMLNRITKNMQHTKNRLNIVILDACRNNPFFRGGEGGLAKIEPRGLFISYATESGSVALDGKKGGNGLFTENLIKYMQEPLSLQDVFRRTREAVFKDSGNRQFPAIYDQTISGDFFFTLPTDNNFSKTIQFIPKDNSIKPIYNFQAIIDFFISNNKSPLLNTIFILFMIFGFGLIIFTTFTSFLYSERTNYMLKILAVSLFFFGISGYIMSTFLHISDKTSFFTSLAIAIFIFTMTTFFAPRPRNEPLVKPTSLIGSKAILLSDIKIGNTGHANISTSSSRYRKLVRNKSDENLFKGDEVEVMSDEAIPIVSKK